MYVCMYANLSTTRTIQPISLHHEFGVGVLSNSAKKNRGNSSTHHGDSRAPEYHLLGDSTPYTFFPASSGDCKFYGFLGHRVRIFYESN